MQIILVSSCEPLPMYPTLLRLAARAPGASVAAYPWEGTCWLMRGSAVESWIEVQLVHKDAGMSSLFTSRHLVLCGWPLGGKKRRGSAQRRRVQIAPWESSRVAIEGWPGFLALSQA